MLSAVLWEDEDFAQLKVEISTLSSNVPAPVRAMVASTVKHFAVELVDELWADLAHHARVQALFDNEVIARRFQGALSQWLVEIFPKESIDATPFLMRQSEIGSTHARIQIPTSLSMLVARAFKRGIYNNLKHTRLSRDEFVHAALYVSGVIDVATAAITAAHLSGLDRNLRAEDALRQVSIDHDFRAEREKQKASLAEWAQAVFFGSHIAGGADGVLPLSRSEFGLWFSHRANLLFGRTAEYASIARLVVEADELVRQLRDEADASRREKLLREIRQIVCQVNNLLSVQFSHSFDMGGAKDPLSRLLNRRYLRAAISREVALRRKTSRPFSMIMLEISQFDTLRARLGEGGADTVVQQTAAMLLNAVRSSDTVFSMGRETFLIIRVGTDAREAATFARGIVQSYAATHFSINGQTVLQNTLKVGVIEYDGHPDPRRLVDKVANALRNEKGAK